MDTARVPPVSFQRYHHVALAAWDCRVCAGDATAAWAACSRQRHALTHNSSLGWHGAAPQSCASGSLLDLAEQAALRPFQALADPYHDLAMIASTSKGDPNAWARALSGHPQDLFRALPGRLNGLLAARLGLTCFQGAPVAAACATGLYSLLEAADLMERRICVRALAGAVDSGLTPLLHAGFQALRVLCGDALPQAFGEPTGFAPAVGAGFIALERKGPWILRAGVRSGDAGHQTSYTDPRTLRCALEALWQVLPQPDLICSHGTGTHNGDSYESAGLDHGPWSHAPRLHCKPYVGHSLGASGAVELAIALEAPVARLWKLSLGFGGHLAAVALERS